jgi:hypothetical protein
MLTQTAVNDVVAGCRQVFEHTLCRLRAGVSQKLSDYGIHSKDVSGLDGVFNDMSDPFQGLESAYLQEKFISQEMGCIVSIFNVTPIGLEIKVVYTCLWKKNQDIYDSEGLKSFL